jgi:hypothetical protein
MPKQCRGDAQCPRIPTVIESHGFTVAAFPLALRMSLGSSRIGHAGLDDR